MLLQQELSLGSSFLSSINTTTSSTIARHDVVTKTLLRALPMALSFTFTFSLVALGILIGHIFLEKMKMRIYKQLLSSPL